MAEVVDIIHNLNYQANTGGLDKAFSALEKNIDAIGQQYDSIARLEALRAQVDKADLTRLNQINVAIDNRKKKIAEETALIAKQIQVNDKLKVSLLNQFGTYDVLIKKQQQLKNSTSTAGSALIDLGRIAQDVPFGFIAIQNNLVPVIDTFGRLIAETGSVRAAITALKTSMVGVAGLGFAISAITSALTFYALSSQGAQEETKDFAKDIDEATDSLDKFLDKINQSTNAPSLFSSPAIKQLEREIKLLQAKGNAEESVFNREQQIRDLEIQELTKQEAAYRKLQFVNKNQSPTDFRGSIAAALPFASNAEIEKIIKDVEKGANLASIAIDKQTKIREALLDKETEAQAATIEKGRKGKPIVQRQEEAKEELKLRLGVPTDPDLESIAQDIQEIDRLQKLIEAVYKAADSSLSAPNLIGGGDETPESRKLRAQLEIRRDIKEKEAEDAKEAQAKEDQQRQARKDAIDDLKNYTIQALQAVYDAQLAYADREIELRENRMEYAIELAERGNVELLNKEREALDQAQQKREQIAARQLQLNAIIQASNQAVALTEAIGAVVKAAAQGDPYTIALRVAAAVAALVAGITTIQQAFSSVNRGFKDGEVDIDGPGTETSDSIPARLSVGESVINAKATRKWKTQLKDINEGREPDFSTVMKPWKRGESGETLALKKELRAVKEAIENISFKASQNMDVRGLSQTVETTLIRERDRF